MILAYVTPHSSLFSLSVPILHRAPRVKEESTP